MLQTTAAAAAAAASSEFKLCVETKVTILLHFVTAMTVQDGGHQQK
jgi:hypothetical protein